MLSKLRRKRIGRRYEYYIGWLLRQDGWLISERTSLGVDDEGIDLIAHKGPRTAYVQCKGWSPLKLIHENVIDHLYGSVAYQVGPDQVHTVDVILYTSSSLTTHAVAHAAKLGVQVLQAEYPRWKRKKQFN